MKKSILFFEILFLLLYCETSQAQYRNSIWCFGDSAGIDFTIPSSPQPYFSAMRSRGTAVSISDTLGQLLFYAHTGDTSNAVNFQGNVKNKLHQMMENGDSIIGISWYQEMVIVPFPSDVTKYYLFTQDVSVNYGIYYSIIDISLNNGLGKIISKNQVLLNAVRMADCITTIKHGNGRDWWMYSRSGDGFLTSNPFYTYIISPSGILLDTLQNIGPLTGGGFIEFRWNKQGTKLAYVNYSGLIQVFDYDRCSGLLSNPITLDTMRPTTPLPNYVACEFSANGRFLYVSSNPDSSSLFVVDLLDTNLTLTNIWTINSPQYYLGDLKRGPDDKIYVTGTYFDGFTFPYPYADSVYNQYNMNLGVIHFPDSGAVGCNYLPYSFYLGGKRTYWGLPNNPNYDMGVIVGSLCDTLSVGLSPSPSPEERGAIMQAWYNPAWNLIHVNASQLKGKEGVIRLLDVNGRTLHEKKIEFIHGGYYTSEIYMNAFSSGIYFVQLITDKEQVANKVMK